MAGHSKWSNIKHKKSNKDIKKGKNFTKLIREIAVSARLGGTYSNPNPRLKLAISEALNNNMKKHTIESAISRNRIQNSNSADTKNLYYEGYGCSGVAFIIECKTDNHKRTVSELRNTFTRFKGNLGNIGSVTHLFLKKGIIVLAENIKEDFIMDQVLNLDIDDFAVNHDKSITITTKPECVNNIRNKLSLQSIKVEYHSIEWEAKDKIFIKRVDSIKQIRDMLTELEKLQDIIHVYHNATLD